MESLIGVLMRRDGLSEAQAKEQIQEARDRVREYLDEGELDMAHDICAEMWGLEPDYLLEII